ncbi:MAG TPA: hypothetical protein VGH22_02070 [Candidatus Binatia bacterium]|jgi:hypothetical protein
MNLRIFVALFVLASLVPPSVSGAENVTTESVATESVTNGANRSQEAKPWVRKVTFGILLHDIGFISDHKENGLDPNWEMEFNRPDWKWWRWVGSPYWMIGATPNFVGDTSAFYFGHTWEISLSNNFLNNLTNDFTKRVWVAGGVSTAIHTGPLKTDEMKCKHEGDCGFGSRVLPRISLEIGANFWGNHAVSLFFDHMSHGSLGCSCIQNEGVDHTGIRYHFTFNTSGKP